VQAHDDILSSVLAAAAAATSLATLAEIALAKMSKHVLGIMQLAAAVAADSILKEL
jgi:hypothetical protein